MTLQASSTAGRDDLLTIGAVRDHIVQFYDDEHFLCRAIGGFLARGMTSGQPLVVIATRARLDAFQDDLHARGLDVVHSRESGLLTLLDARETLGTFMKGAMPDAQLFERNIGGVIRTSFLANPRQCVRAYGEMVDLLWKDGNPEAALRLEDLWNDLGRTYSLCLLCAYSMDNFYKESHGRNFRRICDRHAHVLPTEQYLNEDNVGRLREISRLQQRAAALEAELEHRKTLEKALREALSARRASEEALRRSQQELTALLTREQAVRIEAERANRLKDEFLAVLSHELRTPLNAILGWTQIASLRPFRRAVIRRALGVIERNAQLQLQLIDELLDISRIQNGKMTLRCEPVDLAVVVNSALDSVRPAALAKSLRLDLVVEEADGVVMGDAARLQQIVWNVLANAVKFTPKQGLVEVTLRRVGSDAEIEVRDDGEGIRADFLSHVFDRFRQADSSSARRHGGLGLGLALARSLAEAHGGSISAASPGPGFGSTFTIRLPVCPVRADSKIEPSISEAPANEDPPAPIDERGRGVAGY